MNTLQGLCLATLGLMLYGCASAPPAGCFATPEEAVHRLAAASDDRAAAEELLGPGGFDLLASGDQVSDREEVEHVRAMILERVSFEDVGTDCKIARLGSEDWELPIPLVRDGEHWRFDVEAGREEVLNRRVGRNELLTLATLRAVVEAQFEYASESRDGLPRAFAQRLFSSEGKHDGLYWPAAEGEAQSPLGPLVADAAEEGYARADAKPTPFHGYFFRPLSTQGAHAPGGARSYLDAQGRQVHGFALLAWPATYGNSGVMSFMVNKQGIVFQKDLGVETAQAAAAITVYDPDSSWMPTED